MTGQHHVAAIVPARDLDASAAFYHRLGFSTVSDYGHYRLLADGKGWHIHLNHVTGWPATVEDNPLGLYLYTYDVDAVAERVRDLIIEPSTPRATHWGTYEFAVSDPNGTLVRVGRAIA